MIYGLLLTIGSILAGMYFLSLFFLAMVIFPAATNFKHKKNTTVDTFEHLLVEREELIDDLVEFENELEIEKNAEWFELKKQLEKKIKDKEIEIDEYYKKNISFLKDSIEKYE